jgi:hypothetical protein
VGLVVSLSRPGADATGVTFIGSELVAKQLELLHESLYLVCVPKTSSVLTWLKNRVTSRGNDCAAVLPSQAVGLAFRSTTSRLEAENAALRHQLIALRRKVRGRVEFTNSYRLFFILLYRWFPSILKSITIMRPETLVRWHRAGFRRYWRWKSRNPGGRPPIHAELRALIQRMSIANVLWGAPRIQGELLKLCRAWPGNAHPPRKA